MHFYSNISAILIKWLKKLMQVITENHNVMWLHIFSKRQIILLRLIVLNWEVVLSFPASHFVQRLVTFRFSSPTFCKSEDRCSYKVQSWFLLKKRMWYLSPIPRFEKVHFFEVSCEKANITSFFPTLKWYIFTGINFPAKKRETTKIYPCENLSLLK